MEAPSSTSVQKATISCWVKRTELGTNQYVWFSGFTADTGSYNFYVRFISDDTLKITIKKLGTSEIKFVKKGASWNLDYEKIAFNYFSVYS